MIIEELARNYLDEKLNCPVWLEIPKGVTVPDEYVLVQKTGGGKYNHVKSAVLAIQSHSGSLVGAMDLNEAVKDAMDNFIEEVQVSKSSLNSDYNFTDTQSKTYRYQAVYDIIHF